ncbi:50S ribosomal protein L35 [Mesoplasma photuris]|uniref:50S ribosomal protein L35 n=1 Tax=Mesoplasma photuris TaxID=217731 RepID=UPI0004E1B8AC|nr:50S ribosomal protein L35 [Mesoplasma photuris]
MPKMKTKKSLAKRVKVKANGTMTRSRKAGNQHRATGKTTKQKRGLAKMTIVHKTDVKRLKGLLQK